MFSQGITQPGIDTDRANALITKRQWCRTYLTFQPEGFKTILWKSNPTRVTDYDPLESTTVLTESAVIDDTTITVDDVELMAESLTITIDTGDDEETAIIRSINPETGVATLTSALTKNHTVDPYNDVSVVWDRVFIDYDSDNKKTIIKYFPGGQNANSEIAGCDIQVGSAYNPDGFLENQKCFGGIYVPYWTGSEFRSIFGAFLCRGKPACRGTKDIRIDSQQSASAVDPDYFVQIEMTHEGDTPDPADMGISFDMWRAAT